MTIQERILFEWSNFWCWLPTDVWWSCACWRATSGARRRRAARRRPRTRTGTCPTWTRTTPPARRSWRASPRRSVHCIPSGIEVELVLDHALMTALVRVSTAPIYQWILLFIQIFISVLVVIPCGSPHQESQESTLNCRSLLLSCTPESDRYS